EPGRGSVARHPELLRDRVEGVRRRPAARDPAPPPLSPEQIPGEKGQDLVRLDVGAGLVEHAEAVGVAVAGEAEARALLAHVFAERDELLFAALRREAAEQRIALGVPRRDP